MVKNVNPNQFKLFYGGQELQNAITNSGDLEPGEDLPHMWDRKAEESKEPGRSGKHGAGVYDSMKEEGYNGMPLTVSHDHRGKYVYNGHHRIAAAAAVARETGRNVWIPVEHNDWDTRANLAPKPAKGNLPAPYPKNSEKPTPSELDRIVNTVLG